MRLRASTASHILILSVTPVIVPRHFRVSSFLAGLWMLALLSTRAFAVLANCWHIPDNSGDLGVTMRNPEFEIGTNTTITIYSGLQKFGNSFGTANQTGGTLYYKGL